MINAIRALSDNQIETDRWMQELSIASSGRLSVAYAPFDYVNANARVVILGLTPGKAQAQVALRSLRQALEQGVSAAEAMKCAKNAASFSGPMRRNLIDCMDEIRLNECLRIRSCSQLFASRTDLVHFTSALRYPVFLDEKNYSGTPAISSAAFLSDMALKWTGQELNALPNAYILPLGPAATQGLQVMADAGMVRQRQILDGLPHPSGANAERIAYFCGRKERRALSSRTNADRLDSAKRTLINRLVAA